VTLLLFVVRLGSKAPLQSALILFDLIFDPPVIFAREMYPRGHSRVFVLEKAWHSWIAHPNAGPQSWLESLASRGNALTVA